MDFLSTYSPVRRGLEQKIPREWRTKIRSKEDQQVSILFRSSNTAECVLKRDIKIGKADACEPLCYEHVRSLEYFNSFV